MFYDTRKGRSLLSKTGERSTSLMKQLHKIINKYNIVKNKVNRRKYK
jgi:hypothetical protein